MGQPIGRTKAQLEIDLALMARLSLEGKTHRQIAILITERGPYPLSHSQVTRDMKKVVGRWKAESIIDIDQLKQRELKGLEHQESECWDAWNKSKEDAVTKSAKKTRPSAGTSKEEVATKQEAQCGDPAFQRLILDIREKRAKILGLNAPERTELSGPNGGPIAVEKHYDDEFLSEWAASFLLERQRPGEAAGLRGEPGAEVSAAVRADLRPDVATERNSPEAGGDSTSGD